MTGIEPAFSAWEADWRTLEIAGLTSEYAGQGPLLHSTRLPAVTPRTPLFAVVLGTL
jgi:hypothetical protein